MTTKNPNESLLDPNLIDYDAQEFEDKFKEIEKYFDYIKDYGQKLKCHHVKT